MGRSTEGGAQNGIIGKDRGAQDRCGCKGIRGVGGG